MLVDKTTRGHYVWSVSVCPISVAVASAMLVPTNENADIDWVFGQNGGEKFAGQRFHAEDSPPACLNIIGLLPLQIVSHSKAQRRKENP